MAGINICRKIPIWLQARLSKIPRILNTIPEDARVATALFRERRGKTIREVNKIMNNQVQTVNNEGEVNERRLKVLELYSKGYTQQSIAIEIGTSQPTVSRDLQALEQLAKRQLKGLAQHAWALALFRVLNSFEALIKSAWRLFEEKKDLRILPIIAMLNEKFLDHVEKCRNFGQNARHIAKTIDKDLYKFEYEDVPSMFEADYGSDAQSENES